MVRFLDLVPFASLLPCAFALSLFFILCSDATTQIVRAAVASPVVAARVSFRRRLPGFSPPINVNCAPISPVPAVHWGDNFLYFLKFLRLSIRQQVMHRLNICYRIRAHKMSAHIHRRFTFSFRPVIQQGNGCLSRHILGCQRRNHVRAIWLLDFIQ